MLSADERLTKIILFRTADVVKNDALIMLDEGALRIHIKRKLLEEGYSLREGSHQKNTDHLVTLKGGQVSWSNVNRKRPSKGINPDIMIQSGDRDVFMELKCFGEFGAKNFFDRGNSSGWDGDLDRLGNEETHLAIVAVSGNLYENAQKSDFVSLLPERLVIPMMRDGAYEGAKIWKNWTFQVRAVRVPAPISGDSDRVVVVVTR